MAIPTYDTGSFRDRQSRVFDSGEAVVRGLDDNALQNWQLLRGTRFFSRMVAQGRLINTCETSGREPTLPQVDNQWAGFLQHDRIPFISYPYEWTFGMLKDAAILQLELLLCALEEGMATKDATPFNVQWQGARSVFIDIPSFEAHPDGSPWMGYKQFCQMYLYPLMLQAYKGVPFHAWFRGNIDGIEPEIFNRLVSLRDLTRPGVLTHVLLHSHLQKSQSSTDRDTRQELRLAGLTRQMVVSNVSRLLALVRGLSWRQARSEWSEYDGRESYADNDRQAKADFVSKAVCSRSWSSVWDLGCNTGSFSRIAAESADYVVAMDSDHLAVERLYQDLKSEGNRQILPLVVDVTNPSPDLGWRAAERKSLQRRGTPDLVICLALVHHLAIRGNIPVEDLVDWLANLCGWLIVEFVTKDDAMVKKLLINKDDIYHDYRTDFFEKCLSRVFETIARSELGCGTRVLYFMRNKRVVDS